VLLQLEETSTITNIDIGNAGAAFVEVQVGRLGTDPDQMKVLLVASSFMSVNEARVGENMGRVRMFGVDKLAKDLAKEKWDLVKVVLTQPFTKTLRYGLSFIALSGPAAPVAPSPATQQPSLGAFKLKAESKQDIAVGSYFARKKADAATPDKPSVAASLRAEATVTGLAQHKAKKEENKRKREVELTPAMMEEAKKRKVGPRLVLPSRNSLPGETSDKEDEDVKENIFKETKKKNEKVKVNLANEKNKVTLKKNEEESKTRKDAKEKQPPPAKVVQTKFAAFSDLLKGVVFTISGFQNPLRGEIRKKALEMGAKYCGDWNSSCTHLVCAFANTPKFNQVVGKGIIVKKDWVEECHRQRKRLPWRRFWLDKRDEGREESEDEIWEERDAGEDMDTDEEIERIKLEDRKEKNMQRNNVEAATSSSTLDPYECDTDEEIEKIKMEEMKEKKKKQENVPVKKGIDPFECDTDEEEEQTKKEDNKVKVKLSNNAYDCDTDEETPENEIDPYDVETDIDEDEIVKLLPDTSNLSLGRLPDYFDCYQFYLHGDFEQSERILLERYIIACGGKVQPYMGAEVMVVITHSRWNKMFDDALAVSEGVEFVQPRWLFKCKDEGRVVEYGGCKVERK